MCSPTWGTEPTCTGVRLKCQKSPETAMLPARKSGDLHHGPTLPGMGVRRRLGDAVHRRRHHVVLGEVGDGVLHAHVGHQVPHGLVDLLPVAAPLMTGGEPGVFPTTRACPGRYTPCASGAGRQRRLAPSRPCRGRCRWEEPPTRLAWARCPPRGRR